MFMNVHNNVYAYGSSLPFLSTCFTLMFLCLCSVLPVANLFIFRHARCSSFQNCVGERGWRRFEKSKNVHENSMEESHILLHNLILDLRAHWHMWTQQIWSENKSSVFPSSKCNERQDVAWVLLDRTICDITPCFISANQQRAEYPTGLSNSPKVTNTSCK